MASVIASMLLLATLLYTSAFAYSVSKDVLPMRQEPAVRLDSTNNNAFASDLLYHVVKDNPTQNIVLSPASIHAGLSLIYLGAEGETAEELRNVLKVGSETKQNFSSTYGNFLKSTYQNSNPKSDAPQLKMATRLYVNNNYKLLDSFNNLAKKDFSSEAENVDFCQALKTVEKINKWVEEQTENKIRNLLQPGAVDSDTTAVLVNAIYFKAKWKYPFNTIYTSKQDFHVSSTKVVKVDLMFTNSEFGYAKLPELNAKAFEMPYLNSDISMLIILPNAIDGLASLERNLVGLNLNEITNRLKISTLNVLLPKFRIESLIDLKKPLADMGCSTMFEDKANLTGIFESNIPLQISEAKHKAFLDCNEGGSEAAGADFEIVGSRSLTPDFYANHPFVFVIHSNNTVFFSGHVANF